MEVVYNRPFFVNELLDAIRPEVISQAVFDAMVIESGTFDINTILTAMTRQLDITGMVPNLAGSCVDAQGSLEILMNLAHVHLMKIGELNPELQEEIFHTLRGNRCTTMRALLILDDIQREIIQQLMLYRQRSPLALAIRTANEEALRELYRKPDILVSEVFDRITRYEDRKVLYQGEPRISYPRRLSTGAIAEVWQYFYMPNIDSIRLPDSVAGCTVGRVLEMLTPHTYQRRYTDDSGFDPRTPVGFMGLIGKVGGALPRLIAKQVKKNAEAREQVMREQEIAQVLYDLFSR